MKKYLVIDNETGLDLHLYIEDRKKLRKCRLCFFTKIPKKPPQGKLIGKIVLNKNSIFKLTMPDDYTFDVWSSISMHHNKSNDDNGNVKIILTVSN